MLRDYQEVLARQAYEIILKRHIVYLVMEMRVGKTTIALRTAELLGAKNVLFITKKKAIASIEGDYQREQFPFALTVINYEQASKYKPIYDVVVVDEAHGLGAYPKPSKRTMEIKKLVGMNYLILASGTPSPETETQLFHQFWVSYYNPFNQESFYKWAKMYVKVKEVVRNGIRYNDYSNANRNDIMKIVDPFMLKYTQKQAGFKQSEVEERIIKVPIYDGIEKLVRYIFKNRYYKFKDGQEIICDTPVKLQSKIHQIYSGTVKTETGEIKVLDESKAKYIAKSYNNKKVAIFYKFIGEGEVLKKTIPNWTASPEEFNKSSDKTFICQITTGSMGTNLSTADVLIFYNIDFSSLQYWQARARLSSLDRDEAPLVHWLFSENGIEHKIYASVQKKKDYTTYYFLKDYAKDYQYERIANTEQNNQVLKPASIRHQNNRYEPERRA